MRLINKLTVLLFVFTQFTYYTCLAQNQGLLEESIDTEKIKQTLASDNVSEPMQYLFRGRVNEDGVNIRTDSTASTEIICKVKKDESLDVISKLYDWYKVRLPFNAPSFIKKDFVALIEGKTAKISKDNVNIRLHPNTASAILGKVNKDERVNVLEAVGEWYKIEPVKNSFGWIHSNFVNKIEEKKIKLVPEKKNEIIEEEGGIIIEGIIKPKTVTRIATHKIISQDNKLYLLRSSRENLNSFNSRKVKITGRLEDPSRKNPIIEIEKIEVLN